VKINVNQIPTEGLTLEEDVIASKLDLETETIKFPQAVKIKARVFKITNTVSADIFLSTAIRTICSRCLNEIEVDLQRNLKLNYPVNKSEQVIDTSTTLSVNGERRPSTTLRPSPEFIEGRSRTIDLGPDIREEIILDYPVKPLCKPDCKGLCPTCGKNLNEGQCNCNKF
jgi:uncharacterized protein